MNNQFYSDRRMGQSMYREETIPGLVIKLVSVANKVTDLSDVGKRDLVKDTVSRVETICELLDDDKDNLRVIADELWDAVVDLGAGKSTNAQLRAALLGLAAAAADLHGASRDGAALSPAQDVPVRIIH
ncbi:hypothetical protein [Rhizobium sp. BE258]|jgi:hypothetical protein|uniref:hypothetical protein n=1 Tax=Rhizobium sp. BE258 TaxID=2817722 RepID=UPI0011D16ADA|nr:hypothetical protein [Rhizobium sp. BE258]MDR7142394.1 hypothetical protein [Rhizobium sp. BE258]